MALDLLQTLGPFFFAVIGAAVGALLYYLADRRVQTRAWKREYAIRNVERIYAPLYRELVSIPPAVRTYWYFPTPDESIKTKVWGELNFSELKLFLSADLYGELKEVYEAALPAYLAAFDKCYRAMLFNLQGYFQGLSPLREMDQGRLDMFIRDRIYNNFRSYFIEGWERVRAFFKTQADFERYVSGVQSQISDEARRSFGATLPANFLELMKARADGLQEMSECRKARDQLLSRCADVSKKLETYIRPPWKA